MHLRALAILSIPFALWSLPLHAKDAGCEASKLVSTGGLRSTEPAHPCHPMDRLFQFRTGLERPDHSPRCLFPDRGSTYPPLGFKAADIRKADVILIGHGHFDHMSDAASVAARTGAITVGAPLTTDKLRTQNLDARQIRTVTGRGGELLKFSKFDVEPILGRQGEPPANVTRAFDQAPEIGDDPVHRGTTGRVCRYPGTRRFGPPRRHGRHYRLSDHPRRRVSHPISRQRRRGDGL